MFGHLKARSKAEAKFRWAIKEIPNSCLSFRCFKVRREIIRKQAA